MRELCSRVYVMEAGRIAEEGPTSRVFENPASDAARTLVDAIVRV
ncbi:hypothetical protein [Denitrobacterium detoxificans]|nr:hypothetical protein [Denitrobacterium detoxificans]